MWKHILLLFPTTCGGCLAPETLKSTAGSQRNGGFMLLRASTLRRSEVWVGTPRRSLACTSLQMQLCDAAARTQRNFVDLFLVVFQFPAAISSSSSSFSSRVVRQFAAVVVKLTGVQHSSAQIQVKYTLFMCVTYVLGSNQKETWYCKLTFSDSGLRILRCGIMICSPHGA